MSIAILKRAADLSLDRSKVPPASEIVEQLIAAEKTARKEKPHHSLTELLGTWKLRWITGTKKTRETAGVVLGAGRYIPKFIDIELVYRQEEQQDQTDSFESLDAQNQERANIGRVENSVKLGIFSLTLTGPIKFFSLKNILVFDFTAIIIKIGSLNIYRGYIRQGKDKEREFITSAIAENPFFVYFLIEKNFIAARGRGGGLALWSRLE